MKIEIKIKLPNYKTSLFPQLTINAEDLVPKLPSPRDLQPFPTTEVVQFKGHTALVRSVDFDPTGQYVVSGSDDGCVKGQFELFYILNSDPLELQNYLFTNLWCLYKNALA